MVFKKWFFILQYLFFDPPWDTGETPPELLAHLEKHSPGRALDLGCGTGTNVITLAEHGWQATGVDFVAWPIRSARRKAQRADVDQRTEFLHQDVLELDNLQEPVDLILDIGCFHVFAGGEVNRYVENVQRLLKPGGSFLLYVHLWEGEGTGQGAAEGELSQLAQALDLIWREDGTEGESRPSAWLLFRKHLLEN